MKNSLFQLVIFSLVLICGCSNTAANKASGFLTNAEKYQSNCEDIDYREKEISCHRLKAGNQFIIGYRSISKRSGSDSQGFEKLTIYSNTKLDPGHKYLIPNDGIEIFYSHGLSFMPGKGGCYGKAKSGFFEIANTDKNQIIVNLSMDFEMKSPLNYQGHCSFKKIIKSFEITTKNYNDLTPWDGQFDSPVNIIDETTP